MSPKRLTSLLTSQKVRNHKEKNWSLTLKTIKREKRPLKDDSLASLTAKTE